MNPATNLPFLAAAVRARSIARRCRPYTFIRAQVSSMPSTTIPPCRLKYRRSHILPLTSQPGCGGRVAGWKIFVKVIHESPQIPLLRLAHGARRRMRATSFLLGGSVRQPRPRAQTRLQPFAPATRAHHGRSHAELEFAHEMDGSECAHPQSHLFA